MQFSTCQGDCFILRSKLEIGFRASITNEKELGKLIEKRPFDPGLRTEFPAHARPIGGCLMQHARARANLLHPTCICIVPRFTHERSDHTSVVVTSAITFPNSGVDLSSQRPS
jgi:hypothetical protein